MKKLLIICLAFMFAGCGNLKVEHIYRSIELRPYIKNLSDNTDHDISKISFLLAKIDDPDYALAGGLNLKTVNMIILDIQSFELSENNNLTFQIDAALAHEYGHYLKLTHNNSELDDDCPASIMNEYIYNISENCWENYKSYYYKELK